MIRRIIKNIKHFLNWFSYFKSSFIKNVYPCKLVGEKIDPLASDTIVLYKICGKNQIIEIQLKKLIAKKNLIEKFSPLDALRLGALALEEIIKHKREDEKRKFHIIKNTMLNSTSSISLAQESGPSSAKECCDPAYDLSCLDSFVASNVYTCKLASWKLNEKRDTIIIFTILGKREGYEIPLNELINSKDLLERFHPTEAIKFGFIALGDVQFQGSAFENEEAIPKKQSEMLTA